jgi:hypothetical protein
MFDSYDKGQTMRRPARRRPYTLTHAAAPTRVRYGTCSKPVRQNQFMLSSLSCSSLTSPAPRLVKRTSRSTPCEGRYGEDAASADTEWQPRIWVERRCAGVFACSNRARVSCGSSKSTRRQFCPCPPPSDEVRERSFGANASASQWLSAERSSLIRRVNVTAVLLGPRDPPVWHPTPSELPRVVGRHTALFFIHSHRQRSPFFEAHAAVLRASSDHWLVSSAHILIYCTNPRLPTSALLDALAQYRFAAARLLVHTAVNIGYRCGLLHSLAVSEPTWRRYPIVAVTHPDVYLFPQAVGLLAALLHVRSRDDSTSLDEAQTAGSAGQAATGTTRKNRTKTLQHVAFLGSPSMVDLPHNPARGPCPLQDCRPRVRGFLSDLFLLRPWLLRRRATHFFANATAECFASWGRRGVLLPPEAALWDGVRASGVSYGTIDGRPSGYRQHQLSHRVGILHTHNTSVVQTMLAQRAEATRTAQPQADRGGGMGRGGAGGGTSARLWSYHGTGSVGSQSSE